MRTVSKRAQDRASFLTPPYEEPAVMLAHAIAELCATIDDAAAVVAAAHADTQKALDRMSDDIGRHLKQASAVLQ